MENRVGRFNCIASPQETLISDLSIAEENLWGLTTKTVRNEINRSKREDVGIRLIGEKKFRIPFWMSLIECIMQCTKKRRCQDIIFQSMN